MKKICGNIKKVVALPAFVIAFAACFCLAACNSGQTDIYGHDWHFDNVGSVQNEGEVIACSADSPARTQDAVVTELYISVCDDCLEITDDSGMSYVFAYSVCQADGQTAVYDIVYNERKGMASVSNTFYYGGDSVLTLVISIDGYSLYFYEL